MAVRRAAACALCLAAAWAMFSPGGQARAEQQMLDFSLSGFGEKGRKSWDLFGKSADISAEGIRLFDIESSFYGDTETVRLTADTGDFIRSKGLLRVEKNVVAETSSGVTLSTHALDWDGNSRLVSTDEPVEIRRQDLTVTGRGAEALQDLKLVTVRENVRAVSRTAGDAPARETVITCDGPLTVDYTQNKAVFENNVLVETPDGTMRSELMDAFLAPPAKAGERRTGPGSSIETVIARGAVTITRGESVSHSQEAVYRAAEQRIILTGRPEITIFPSEAQGAPVGD